VHFKEREMKQEVQGKSFFMGRKKVSITCLILYTSVSVTNMVLDGCK